MNWKNRLNCDKIAKNSLSKLMSQVFKPQNAFIFVKKLRLNKNKTLNNLKGNNG